MAYQALYRKYRPIDFSDVVGQEVVVQTLKNALKNSKTSHAYMFSGPRGTGKTTIAKIFAKDINCLEPKNGVCCGKCKNCLAISSNECTDIIEIDAASNNGVDEIREIRNKINLVPSELKYKVYIIDEVHMLSIGAFNALLKTLEEPPEHIIFILATTDPHKVPITIVSRCQCFEFKRISESAIVERLKYVCEQEKIDVDDDVLQKIAKISEGGMRDSLGILDKVSSYCTDKITLDIFNKVNGIVNKDYLENFILLVYQKNILEIINTIDDLYNSGKDFVIFAQDLIELLRDKMIKFYLKEKEEFPIDFIVKFIEQLNKLLIHSRSVGKVKILFETSLLEFVGDISLKTEIMEEKENIPVVKKEESAEKPVEKEIKNTDNQKNEVKSKAPVENNTLKEEELLDKYNEYASLIINNTFATAQKDLLNQVKSEFLQLNDFVLDKSYGAAACYLIDSEIRAVGNEFMILTCNYESVLERGINLLKVIEELIGKLTNSHYKVAIITEDMWKKEREQFIKIKTAGEKYVLKEIPTNFSSNFLKNQSNVEKKIDDDDIVNQAIAIFGEDIVKIK